MPALELKTIGDIGTKIRFFVPSYQRGYRWDQRQIIDLLDDLYTFQKDQETEPFYCLQPVVVRERENDFEVIDGQQRLTTISILLQCLNRPTYRVRYETRPNSQHMLASLKDFVEEEAMDVDHHYFKEAYLTIQRWIEKKQMENRDVVASLYRTLENDTRVIWYKVDEQVDAHELFMRLNIGKIPLTNTELIKASLLEPLSDSDRQRFALEWEAIEQRLQDDAFWYFLQHKTEYINRIELLFELVLGRSRMSHDVLHTFLNVKEKEEIWRAVRTLFAQLQEWYENRETYHLIGYLLHARTSRTSLTHLLTEYTSDDVKTKETFLEHLQSAVRATFPKDLKDIQDYRYDEDNVKIQDVLLFFNILEEIQSIRDSHRFPFDHYVKEKWSLEHIHARKTEMLKTYQQWTQWLKDVRLLLDPVRHTKLLKDIEKLLSQSFGQDEFDEMVLRIEKELDEKLMITGEAMHHLGNLALLDRQLNSKLGNYYYPMKFTLLKKHEQDGKYIPPATRKAFWKYYSDVPSHFEYWTATDQKDYQAFIIERLAKYFKEETYVDAHH